MVNGGQSTTSLPVAKPTLGRLGGLGSVVRGNASKGGEAVHEILREHTLGDVALKGTRTAAAHATLAQTRFLLQRRQEALEALRRCFADA